VEQARFLGLPESANRCLAFAMIERIGDQIIVCQEEAAIARLKAIMAPTPQMRHEYRKLEKHWLHLGRSLGFAATVSGHLEWRSRRLPL
jgi:hypothetical protein